MQAAGSDDQYLAACVRIEPTRITDEFVRVPSDMAYWHEKYAVAYQQWLLAKLQREQTYATLYLQAQTAIALTGKKGTIADIENAVLQDPEYTATRAQEGIAEVAKIRLHGVLDTLRTKKDMLVSLGAHMRAEMGDLSMRQL